MQSSSFLSVAGWPVRTRPLFLWLAWLAFALFTAALTLRHALWFDEMQAWLLVRDSPTLAALFHNLRYEGHPALWYLLLYPLTRLTSDPAAMQALNYVLALAMAGLVLSAPRLRPLQAVLIVFSSILFNEYSTFARSYLLASLLLLVAVRLLLAERPRVLLAAVCLAFAINTHFLTLPIVLCIAMWFVLAGRVGVERTLVARLQDRRILASGGILAAAALACYCTLRPAADILRLNLNQPSVLGHLLFVEGRIWRIFFRVPISHFSPHMIALLDPKFVPSALASLLSLATLLLTLVALRTRAARLFFLAASVSGLVVLAVVTWSPEIRHYGFIYVAFVLAVLMDAAAPRPATRSAARLARSALYLILLQQCLLSITVSAKEWRQPISGSLQTARWIQQHNLAANPLILEPNEGPNVLLGYLNKPRAWFPACQCWGSFAHRAIGTDALRMATMADMAAARAGSKLAVVLVANFPLDPATARALHVELLFASSPEAIKPNDNFFVYRQSEAQ
jgi:hypothetical protein